MNHTKNYNLPQWSASDRIRMDDFNNAMASIEAGISNAQSTADSARSEAADLPYVTGSYVGQGVVQTIGVGFQPSFVIISGMDGSKTAESFAGSRFSAMTGGNRLSDRVQFTIIGFSVMGAFGEGNHYPNLNAEGVTYDYIAFK